MPIIALTTDFGTSDYFVAAMKGVIFSITPDAKITDITHEIPPQDVSHGGFVLAQVWHYFPAGTIHVAVVDPGVGTNRRIILGEYDARFIIAPDNGLISWIHEGSSKRNVRSVENERYFLPDRSSTFHGRDIMAPVAAHLAASVSPEAVGPVIDDVLILDIPFRAERDGEELRGRVIHIDRFGNLVTNIHREQLNEGGAEFGIPEVSLDGQPVGALKKTFGDVAVGETVVIIGSAGFVEVCVRDGNAAERYVPSANAVVTLRINRGRVE